MAFGREDSLSHIRVGNEVVPGAQRVSDIRNAEETPPVRIYRDMQNIRHCPIGTMPTTWSFWDMLFEQSQKAQEIRECFHDWALPDTQAADMGEGRYVTNVMSVKRIARGDVTTSAFKVEEYLYVTLNSGLFPTREMGSANGTPVDRTTVLVCVECGDPRRMNNLQNAHIKYAVRCNAPWTEWCHVATRIMDLEKKIVTFYDIFGDEQLRQELTAKWFGKGYVFNRDIYPVAINAVANEFI